MNTFCTNTGMTKDDNTVICYEASLYINKADIW